MSELSKILNGFAQVGRGALKHHDPLRYCLLGAPKWVYLNNRNGPTSSTLEDYQMNEEMLRNINQKKRQYILPSSEAVLEFQSAISSTAPLPLDDLEIPKKSISKEESEGSRNQQTGFKKPGISVPTSSLSRTFELSRMVLGIVTNSVKDASKSLLTGSKSPSMEDIIFSRSNTERLGRSLCRLRGAALKLGQYLSLQESMLPIPLRDALVQARSQANPMPEDELESSLIEALGNDWRSKFEWFEMMPFAAASIGQVHKAKTKEGEIVAVKVQYKGISDSIDSDLRTLLFIANHSKLLPESLFADQLCKEMSVELKAECDFENEARFYRAFAKIFQDEKGIQIPTVLPSLSNKKILTTSFCSGKQIGDILPRTSPITPISPSTPLSSVSSDSLSSPSISTPSLPILSQRERDSLGERLIWLCLRELFTFRIMQTDPNPGNFLYDQSTDTLTLLDFGACRLFDTTFVDQYLRTVMAAAKKERQEAYYHSCQLGFIGERDNEDMIKAHVASLFAVAEPFQTEGEFDFSNCRMMETLKENAGIMVKNRTCPPPPPVYSLHRKLSGCFLLCISLGARVNARQMLEAVYQSHSFATPNSFDSSLHSSPFLTD